MRKKVWFLLLSCLLVILAACGNDHQVNEEDGLSGGVVANTVLEENNNGHSDHHRGSHHSHHHGYHNYHHHGHHHLGYEGFSMHFNQPKNVEKGKKLDLIVHLQDEDTPMHNGRVHYEIWSDQSDKHEWYEAKEGTPGEYTSTLTFDEAGTYNFLIHVENENGLHEHETHMIEVK